MNALPRQARCLHPGCAAAPTVGMLCSHHASPRHAPVRATVLPAAVVLDAAGASLAAEGDTRDEDQLPPPWRCGPRVVAIHRARLGLRIASLAQAVAVAARRASTGGDLDGLNDSYDDLEAAMREGMPWMRAALGER